MVRAQEDLFAAASRAKARVARRKLRDEVIEAYGGQCICCGEDKREFLTIDHVYGGGNQERKGGLRGDTFLRWLRKHNYPRDKYQVLCWNCNAALGIYGFCPHGTRGLSDELYDLRSRYDEDLDGAQGAEGSPGQEEG